MIAVSTLKRHGRSSSQKALVLRPDHPAVLEGRPLFSRSAIEYKREKARVLVSGVNSRKIGKFVTKGKWAGFPIFTLTLEERRTCPRSCVMWAGCYGNRMHWALRWPAGKEMEGRIQKELAELQDRYPEGFVVRLHVLGDFYSTEYVTKWRKWLYLYPALRVYGYTARRRSDPIGRAVERLARRRWGRSSARQKPSFSWSIEMGIRSDEIIRRL